MKRFMVLALPLLLAATVVRADVETPVKSSWTTSIKSAVSGAAGSCTKFAKDHKTALVVTAAVAVAAAASYVVYKNCCKGSCKKKQA